ncbi:MAG TPA: hypothetical protein VMS21_05930, partial [Methylomirabilota bacterium]|nr:hypothetical protein [Methylomirabilota bacterium]
MSLPESLLLDPPQLDVWLALRTDGARGSGTESDPYDAGVRPKLVLSVSSIVKGGTGNKEATVTTSVNHGYSTGDIVVIAGAAGSDGLLYNGTFSIYSVTSTTFKYLMRVEPGANAMGTLTCTLDPHEFDALMRSLPSGGLTIHLGPGTFETKGFTTLSVAASWQPKSGWRIVGSGMKATVLKLVGASVPIAKYLAIGNLHYSSGSRLNGFEVSDLTVDCNLGGQPVQEGQEFAPLSCGAVQAGGSHIRIRRVRAINFGSQTSSLECFVLSAAWAHPDVAESVDCVIEDCLIEEPAVSGSGLTTCILMGAGERPSDGVMAYHRGAVVRNCVVDCEYKLNPVAIKQITFSGTTATVTTWTPHDRATNGWIRIAGALVNGSFSNPFNGSFKITSVPASDQFTYTMQSTPAAQPLGDMWVDRFSSHFVDLSQVSRSGSGSEWTVTVTTTTPHFRV